MQNKRNYMSDNYADIRPFNDDEVAEVLQRLLASNTLLSALLQYRFPALPTLVKPFFLPLFSSRLKREFAGVNSVESFQVWLEPRVEELLRRSTTEVTVEGLDKLDPSVPYVWISNHRDIAMDPTMINYSLHLAGWPTSRIAIGDNLLHNPDVADIMRLNKSFIVKRSVENKRQKLRELQRLSGYIRHSVQEGQSIWIAQREGRAKDGIDKTDTAVLKMLALHGRERKESFAETMIALNPVPVSIQYEWDPCDQLKAQELVARAAEIDYTKDEDEDVRSILAGLTGVKGRVKVNFGSPLTAEQLQDADIMASSIDQQLTHMIDVLPVHYAALRLLQQRFARYPDITVDMPGNLNQPLQELQQRIAGQNPALQQRLLENYATPLLLSLNRS